MAQSKMTIAELNEAVQVYVNAKQLGLEMPALMELLQQQTDYYQKRFWKLADAALGERVGA